MLWQTNKTLWLNYPDTYTKIRFTGRLHLWWPLLLCRAIANGFHPTTHKVSLYASKPIILPKTRASRYSHHLGQFALLETHWPFRVSGCDPYLNPYLNIYTTRHHKVSPRDSWNYAYHLIRIMLLIQFPPLFGHSSKFHVKTSRSHKPMINLIPSMPISFINSKHPSIFTYIIFRRNNLNNACKKNHLNSQGNIAHIRTLAQARCWPHWCSGFSPRRDKQQGFFTNSRSSEISSPERDRASLRTWIGRLGERSRQNLRRASDILA